MKVTIDQKKGIMNVEIELNKVPVKSGSGKTMVIASTSGNRAVDATYNGEPVILGLNAYYKPAAGE